MPRMSQSTADHTNALKKLPMVWPGQTPPLLMRYTQRKHTTAEYAIVSGPHEDLEQMKEKAITCPNRPFDDKSHHQGKMCRQGKQPAHSMRKVTRLTKEIAQQIIGDRRSSGEKCARLGEPSQKVRNGFRKMRHPCGCRRWPCDTHADVATSAVRHPRGMSH